MNLTDAKIKNAKPGPAPYKLTDGGGLYLFVTTAGGKLWRYNYRFHGKQKTEALGKYPDVSLSEARERLQDAKKALGKGIDLAEKRKASNQADNFKAIAFEWHERMKPSWTPGHAKTIKTRLEKDVFPYLGNIQTNAITPPEILMVLRRVEARGAIETAHRIKTICGQVFRYAVATGRAERDPAADLKGALPVVQPRHMAALTNPADFSELLKAIDNYKGTFAVKSALQMQAYTFVRPGELRHAEWQEIDLDACQWDIPAGKMKIRQPHIVPLARQVVDILKNMAALTGGGKYVFPGRTPARPLSENAILTALRTMGFTKEQMSGHGFRAIARTLLDEGLGQRVELIEHQLAHAVRDPLGRAYNRTQFLDARRGMMQLWADYIDGLKAGAQVIAFKIPARP